MYPRLAESRVRAALAQARVVLLMGPRQAGKTTLARLIAGKDMRYMNLDDPTVLSSAETDPVGFVRALDRGVIDEIQRVPNLLLALKAAVDTDPRPGQFLLTGSANLMTIPRVSESLAGRVSMIRLLPLAQAELRERRPTFLERAFSGDALIDSEETALGDDLLELVLKGGYPEPLTRESAVEREIWHEDYVEAIVQRDVRDIAQIGLLNVLPRLLRVLAESSSQLVNFSRIGSALNMNHVTTREYVTHLANLFLVTVVPPWHSNALKRLVKTPKLHFLDSGLLATLKHVNIDRIRLDRSPLGAILESFVLSELLKIAYASTERLGFYHFRDKEKNEVDIVMENRNGYVVGIEVKASSTVTSGDFKGMRRLQSDVGERFVAGFVLYDHARPVPFGDRFAAVPISALWT